MVYGYGGWQKNFSLAQMSDLRQKVAIVTGSNSGVGKETVGAIRRCGTGSC